MATLGGDRSHQVRHVAARVLIDIVILNLSCLMALALSCIWDVSRTPDEAVAVIERYRSTFLTSTWLLTAIALGVFTAAGFYHKGKLYRGKYRLGLVSMAILLAYLVYSFIGSWTGLVTIEPWALVVAAGFGGSLLVGSRFFSSFWKSVAIEEMRQPDMAYLNRPIRHVLVIGGAGYVGSALMPKLLERGYKVTLLDMLMYGDEPVRPVMGHKNLEIMQGDFRHVDTLVEAMYGKDAVIHLGAIVGDPACALNEEFTIEVNLAATRLAAEVAKASNIVRFVFASTCSVYGASDDVLDEESDLNPVSLYARSKIAAEEVLKNMVDERFQPTILRFGTIYGLSGRTRFDLVVNLLTAKAIKDNVITVFGEDQWRPFLHVDDAALSVLMALEARLEDAGNRVFNVGSDEQNMTLGQVGQLIKKLVPTAELKISGGDADRRNYRVSFKRIRDAIGFKPQWTVEMGIKQVIDAFEAGKINDYRDSKYSNVKFLTEEAGEELMRTEREWLDTLVQKAAGPDTPKTKRELQAEEAKPITNGTHAKAEIPEERKTSL